MTDQTNMPMVNVVQDIVLDVSKREEQVRVNVKKGDTNSRVWRFCLVDEGKPLDLSHVSVACFRAMKPDGTKIWNSCVIRDNVVEYTVTPHTVDIAGSMHCEVDLIDGKYDAEDRLLTENVSSAQFTVVVHEPVFDAIDLIPETELSELTRVSAENQALKGLFPVNTAHIGDAQVTSEKLAYGAVTPEKTDFAVEVKRLKPVSLTFTPGELDEGSIEGTIHPSNEYMVSQLISVLGNTYYLNSDSYKVYEYSGDTYNGFQALLADIPPYSEKCIYPRYPATTHIRIQIPVEAQQICSLSVVEDKLNIQIPRLLVDGSQISDDTIPETALSTTVQEKLNDKTVNTGNIVDNAVTTAKLADGAVATQKLEDGAVTMAKLASEVTDAIEAGGEIADGAVTPEKTSFITDMEWTVKGGIGTIYFNSGGSGLAVTGGRDYLLFENISLTEEKLSMLTLTVTDESGAVLDTYALASLAVISTGDMTYDHGRYIHMPPKAVKMVISITPPEDDPDTCFDVDYTVCSLNTILSIPYLEVGTNNLRDGSVTSDKLETGAVTMAKLGTDVKEALSGALKREIVPALPSTDGSVLAMRTLPYTGRNMTNSNLITTNWISLDAVSDLSPVTDAKRIKMTVTLTSTDGQIAVYSGGEIRLRYHGADGNKMTCPLSGISWQEGDNQLDIPLTRFTPANSPSWSNIDEITVFTYGANQAGSYSITVSDLRIVDASVGIDPHTIYLVPSAVPETENVYNEYMYINYQWEQIGSTAVDLSGYYTKTESDDKLSEKVNIYDLVNGMYTVPDAQYAVHAVDAGADGNGNNIAETYATKTEMETKLAALEVRLATLEGDGV